MVKSKTTWPYLDSYNFTNSVSGNKMTILVKIMILILLQNLKEKLR